VFEHNSIFISGSEEIMGLKGTYCERWKWTIKELFWGRPLALLSNRPCSPLGILPTEERKHLPPS
jgi:hypothetical protein